MRILAAILFLLPALSFGQSRWVNAQPDRFNLLYSEGESAQFSFRANALPTDPNFHLVLTMEEIGIAAPVDVPLTNGFATFESSPLAAGNPEIRLEVKLVGDGNPSWESVVQEETWTLDVVAEQ